MKNIVVFTGAGISAESGLGTFRDSNGLWDNYKIEEVATPQAFKNNPALVLDFYNIRRRQLLKASPNIAHKAINKLKEKYNLNVITQNIDDLHERSGTRNVLHLHGKLTESKSTFNNEIYEINGSELNIGDTCQNGKQLRPNVVWFGEDVPNMEIAIEMVKNADIFIVIGTSLNVYPAASLLNFTKNGARNIVIDPKLTNTDKYVELISEKATTGVPRIVDMLMS
tara:strand:+ start:59 stop:733 length:675 start_codon:yes stop_codon:yes gene_type:complete